ncbi:uncharacterized protein LOC122498367 [Leptopilina heterotoma]|uniref:uncharacterized protein LOC122498367 n=1 Tax=Leptopilina heterotoma TaxID=63436 RepID=UPI001CA94A44|nr:uncharacterized protein LOC122498367 [Leptopilina heterotoma]
MNEPVRKSYFDIVKRNLRAADRQIVKIMNELNSKFSDIPIFGLMLIYQKYFIHLVTAPEEMIFRHLKAIFFDTEEIKLGKVLHLPVQHHVYRPYLTKWYSIITKPPILLEKLENTELSEIERHVENMMIKIYKLCEFLMDTKLKTDQSIHEILQNIEKKVPEFLPEITVLEYLLNANSPVFYDLRVHLKIIVEIPYVHFYSDRVWPTPCNFMPTFSFSSTTSGKDREK